MQLKEEIWLTQGMINLIPTKLLINNERLREEILKRKL